MLPIKYGRMGYTGTPNGNDEVSSDAAFPAKMYNGWMYGRVFDDVNKPCYIYDIYYTTGNGGIFALSTEPGPDYTNDVSDALALMGFYLSPTIDYINGGSSAILDWTDALALTTSRSFTSAKPAYIDYAYGDPYYPGNYDGQSGDEGRWGSKHIYTNVSDAIGVHVYDIEDVTEWSDAFALHLATEMAYRASKVHAKSSKMVASLNDDRREARNDFAAESNEDEGGVRQRYSTAELARR